MLWVSYFLHVNFCRFECFSLHNFGGGVHWLAMLGGACVAGAAAPSGLLRLRCKPVPLVGVVMRTADLAGKVRNFTRRSGDKLAIFTFVVVFLIR